MNGISSWPAALLLLGAGFPCAHGQAPAETPHVETTFHAKVSPELMPMAREAREDFDQGKYEHAEQIYRKLLARDPNNPYLLSNQGVVLFRESKLESAVAMLEKAVSAAPKDPFTLQTLGAVYYSMHNYGAAEAYMIRVIQIDPKNASAYNFLDAISHQKNRPK